MVFTKLYQLSASVLHGSLRALRSGRGRLVLAGPSAMASNKDRAQKEGEGEQGIRRREKENKEEGTVLNKASTEGE